MSGIVEWYRDLIDNRQDPRTEGWFLVSSPGPTLTIVATYIYFCVSAGPRYMKDKKPYDLKNTMIIYNFIQILLSLYLVHEGLLAGWLYEYNFTCQPVDYSYKPSSVRGIKNEMGFYNIAPSPLRIEFDPPISEESRKDDGVYRNHVRNLKRFRSITDFNLSEIEKHIWKMTKDDISNDQMARAVYTYFICKLIELLDTVFFVMRKKDRQISFLHLYHHSMMPICAWIGIKFFAGGHPTLLGVINSFIHVFMYTYYMLAAFGPHMQKYLWWKRHLTTMQIVQFIIIFFHNLQMLFTSCNFPKPLSFLLMLNSGLFIYMFGSFYVNNYVKSKNRRSETTKKSKTNGVVCITANGSISVNGNSIFDEIDNGKSD